MNLSPEEELRLSDPFHWTRDFKIPLGTTSLRERLRKHVDTEWRWSFLGPKPRKNYFGHIQSNRFIIHNTPGLAVGPTIRLIGEWRDEEDTLLRIRFSWHSLLFLAFSFVALLLGLVATYFCLKFDLACWMPMMCLGMEALLCAIMFVPTWLEYRAALRFLRKDIGIVSLD